MKKTEWEFAKNELVLEMINSMKGITRLEYQVGGGTMECYQFNLDGKTFRIITSGVTVLKSQSCENKNSLGVSCTEDTPCEEHCDHGDQDEYSCLDCGKEMTEDKMAAAYDRAKDRMKYGE